MVKTIFKRILFFSLCAILSTVLSAQEISGSWHGKLLLPGGISLRLVFNISKTDAGYSATMDSPDQGAKGIPMTSATLSDNLLTIIFDAAKIKYTGQAVGNDSIAGTFEQFGNSSPLGLKLRTEAVAKLNRPQEPTAPFPYKSEDLKFGNYKDNVILSGTLTMPEAGENFPAVILVSGSGAQNRNEELMGHKPFLVIADYLTRNGFAVLRYDDRGSFESTGDFSKATTFDLANDAEAAFNYLKTRKEINPEKIGIMGHSEGGIIAPIIAARNPEIALIVMLAGPGLKGSEILLLQQQAIGKVNGISEIELKNNHDLNNALFSLIDKNKNPVALRFLLTDYLKESVNKLPALKVPEGMSKDEFIEMQLKQILTPWMLEFIRFNPAPTLEKVKCPVLALIGSKDLQVPAKENIPALITASKKGGNEKAIVKELDGLNHLFQNCNTGSPAEYSTIEETFAPDALKLITDWLKKQ
jgi:uncharacterized protein